MLKNIFTRLRTMVKNVEKCDQKVSKKSRNVIRHWKNVEKYFYKTVNNGEKC